MKTEQGSASILIELEGGNITVKHGTDGTILRHFENVEAGTWKTIWNSFYLINTVKESQS